MSLLPSFDPSEPQDDTCADAAVALDPALSFDHLGLPPALLRAVHEAGYPQATLVQAQAIPPGLEGLDLMVSASTGSGKTASFILPALARVLAARGDNHKRREKGVVHGPRALVLCPTRELALQVAKAAEVYGRFIQGLRVATVVGGVPYAAQIKSLRGPLDVLISTPGRLLDHLGSGKAVLDHVELFVLDEADRMLDMGFIEDIQAVAQTLPASRQTMMYSATFAGHVGRLAHSLLREGAQTRRIDVASHTDTHEHIEQRLHWADNPQHKNALLDHILTDRELEQAVVFTSTQRDADWLADRLGEMGHSVAALHGGMPQGRRNRVLQGLRSRQLRVLVATDVAARGIDVPTISHVVNYGLPMKAEDYVHRIGRTGRAGRSGLAITLAERMDVSMIRRIQHFTTQAIPVAAIAGLEPKSPEPRLMNPRAGAGQGGARHGGRGQGERGHFDRAHGDRGSRGSSWGGQGFKPRRDEMNHFAPRRPHGEGHAFGHATGHAAAQAEGFDRGARFERAAPSQDAFARSASAPGRPAYEKPGKPGMAPSGFAKPGPAKGGFAKNSEGRPAFGKPAFDKPGHAKGGAERFADRSGPSSFGPKPAFGKPAFGKKPGFAKPARTRG
jgi:superfamily II DNA/RNA helicase